MSAAAAHRKEPAPNSVISGAVVELYATFYQHDRTAAIDANDMIVVSVLENIVTTGEDRRIVEGARDELSDGRVAFQTDTEDKFTATLEGLTSRHVTAFLSANDTMPGVGYELFFLDATALTSKRSPRGARTEPSEYPRRGGCVRRRSADVAGEWRKRRRV